MAATDVTLDVTESCQAISDQAARFAKLVGDADLRLPVNTCPGWTLQSLVAHVGNTHRWAYTIVTAQVPDAEHLPAQKMELPVQQSDLEGWLNEGAGYLVDALRDADPAGPLWNPTEDGRSGIDYWARRMLHETTVHRADAAVAVGAAYELEPRLAADAISEWLTMVCSPAWAKHRTASMEALRGEGQSMHLHATDEDPALGEAGEWVIHREQAGPRWEHGHAKADVAVRGPAMMLLMLLTRRVALSDELKQLVEVHGDTELLTHWLNSTAF